MSMNRLQPNELALKRIYSGVITALMTLLVSLAGCATQPITSDQNNATDTFQDHPILGIWNYTENGCTESYQFLSSGTRKSTSGSEVIEAVYTISIEPLPNGYYVLTDEVVLDVGGIGCNGVDADLTGDRVKLFVKFGPDRKTLRFCDFNDINQCFGPLKKQEISFQ